MYRSTSSISFERSCFAEFLLVAVAHCNVIVKEPKSKPSCYLAIQDKVLLFYLSILFECLSTWISCNLSNKLLILAWPGSL